MVYIKKRLARFLVYPLNNNLLLALKMKDRESRYFGVLVLSRGQTKQKTRISSKFLKIEKVSKRKRENRKDLVSSFFLKIQCKLLARRFPNLKEF